MTDAAMPQGLILNALHGTVRSYEIHLLSIQPFMPPKVIFVDIDDTLVRSVGTKRIPMPAVIKQVRELKERGAEMYLWSSGGAEYCRSTAAELGITDCFLGFLPKPNVYIDDQAVPDWRFCKHLYPSQAGDA